MSNPENTVKQQQEAEKRRKQLLSDLASKQQERRQQDQMTSATQAQKQQTATRSLFVPPPAHPNVDSPIKQTRDQAQRTKDVQAHYHALNSVLHILTIIREQAFIANQMFNEMLSKTVVGSKEQQQLLDKLKSDREIVAIAYKVSNVAIEYLMLIQQNLHMFHLNTADALANHNVGNIESLDEHNQDQSDLIDDHNKKLNELMQYWNLRIDPSALHQLMAASGSIKDAYDARQDAPTDELSYYNELKQKYQMFSQQLALIEAEMKKQKKHGFSVFDIVFGGNPILTFALTFSVAAQLSILSNQNSEIARQHLLREAARLTAAQAGASKA